MALNMICLDDVVVSNNFVEIIITVLTKVFARAVESVKIYFQMKSSNNNQMFIENN